MPLRVYRRRLPHWRLNGATYFVTWRLHRSQADLTHRERTTVTRVILHWESVRFTLHALVVMNDHVHLLVTPNLGNPLERLVQGWKAFAADHLRQNGRSAPFWQREYHDRLVRSRAEFEQKLRYIALNPPRRWPECESYRWLWLRGNQ
jgi:REP element-mobilizing transposase RayT